MPARPLIFYPDERLRRPTPTVEAFDNALAQAADDVLETLRAVSAIGLTAPHIGSGLRLAVIRLQPDLPHAVYVNPEVVWASPETAPQTEGSVSMPGITEPVERSIKIRVRFQDLAGTSREEEADDFAAACLLHEIDQLDGIFWIDRLTRLRRERALKRYAKLQRQAP